MHRDPRARMNPPIASGDIAVVDDDPSIRDALSMVFTLAGYRVDTYASGEDFIDHAQSRLPDCIVLDIHLPGMSGLDVLKQLRQRHIGVPVLMLSGDNDIPVAVQAIKNGAIDYLVKPFNGSDMLCRISGALAAQSQKDGAFDFPGCDRLTPREREVLAEIAAGASNKEAGRRLKISPRTVEVHRARIMDKLGARNAADLVRIALGRRSRNVA